MRSAGDKSNEFLLIKKRKSIEEAKRAKDTCPAFYDETVLVAEQLADVKEENTALMRQIISLNEQILSLDRTKAQFEKERATVFRDACVLYKRGIVELQLSLFMDSHGGTHYEFYCGRDVIPKTFKDAMHHWCSCPLHEVHILNSYKEDRVNLALYAEKEAVKNSLFYLYDTISSLLHFNAGEEYPIRVVPFAKPADTLAFMTFLQHYSISMFLASVHPVPAFDSNTHTPVPVQGAVKDAEVAK